MLKAEDEVRAEDEVGAEEANVQGAAVGEEERIISDVCRKLKLQQPTEQQPQDWQVLAMSSMAIRTMLLTMSMRKLFLRVRQLRLRHCLTKGGWQVKLVGASRKPPHPRP